MQNKEYEYLKKQKPVRRLMKRFSNYKARIIISLILSLIKNLAYALSPLLIGLAINELKNIFTTNKQENFDNFLIYSVIILGVFLIYAVSSYVSSYIVTFATENVIYDLRKDVDKKLSRLPLNYYDTHAFGDILSRVTNDVDTLSANLQSTIQTIFDGIIAVIITLYIMISINGMLTLVATIMIPIVILISLRISSRSQKYMTTQQKAVGEINGYVEEYYSGYEVVTLFNKQEDVEKKFEKLNFKLFDAGRRGLSLVNLLPQIMDFVANANVVVICFGGAMMSIYAGLSIGMIQAFTQYMYQVSGHIKSLMEVTGVVQIMKASIVRIFEFLDEDEEVLENANPKFPEKLEGKVEFDHVSFGYLPHKTLINDISWTVNPGEKTAIVGPTGAGKTTLINLIMRFYDVNKGSIKIDGVDIKDMKREKLRDIFGMVLQETWLYSGTIMENIRYGRLDATDEEVIEAAKKARADSFIEKLPNGYQFKLQEGAQNLAIGQRQLLTIARAMLSNPTIMILDEATSSVDTRTELMIQDAMAKLMKGRTSFVIAHRLSTIKDSDNIMYMQDGDILEVGSHDELMAKDGLYAKLYNSQFADDK